MVRNNNISLFIAVLTEFYEQMNQSNNETLNKCRKIITVKTINSV